MTIKLKRIYGEASQNDGIRILVDRLWPRGVSKEKANLDHWLKEIGPSNDLRKSFHNEELIFTQFQEKYKKELKSDKQKEALDELKSIIAENKKITLLFAAKNEEENQATILKKLLK